MRALSAQTWNAYAALVERHNGAFGGCWCAWFHRPAGDAPGVPGLGGSSDLIAPAGGGVVEGYPHDTRGARQAVLYDGTRSLYERAGFTYARAKGLKNTVMVTTVAPSAR